MKAKIKRLCELYEHSKEKGFTLSDWHEAVDLLQEIIAHNKKSLEKWL